MNPQSRNQFQLFGGGFDEAWSYSRLKTLRSCALEYKVRWVDGQGKQYLPYGIDIQAGRLLHDIVREYYSSEVPSQPLFLLLEICEKLALRIPLWKTNPQFENRILKALQLFADSKAAHFRKIKPSDACKGRIGGVLFTGTPDLIYQVDELAGVHGILEFKLNDVEVSGPNAAEKFLQCLIYYMILPKEDRRFCELASIYVFDSGQMLNTEIEQSIIDRAIGIIDATLQLAKNNDFPPTLNPFCPSCGYRALCPVYSKLCTR